MRNNTIDALKGFLVLCVVMEHIMIKVIPIRFILIRFIISRLHLDIGTIS